jgi:hypothetical protein
VGVHLLRQLAGELDRLNLRREGATEDALDQALDARFKISQNADCLLLLRRAGPEAGANPRTLDG